MTKLANLRDGSFYTIEELDKVKDYFINALGGCMTVLFNEIELKIKVLNEKCKIKKIFGKDKLYKCELTENNLDVRCLQFISGKVYTFTIEVELPDVIPINENILDVEFLGDNHEKINKVVKYSIVVGGFSLADEEYLRCQYKI